MATIFYSVMGEGRGHAARARAMVERLRDHHRIVLYSSYDALEFLRKVYANDPAIEVRETDGIKFHYTDGKLDLILTIRQGLSLWWNMRRTVRRLEADIVNDKPDLVVSDFEPTMPRAAHRHSVPVLSLDHQHFLKAYDLSSAPTRLRHWAWAMSWSVWMFGVGQHKTVISAFYKPPLLPKHHDAIQVGPLLRPAIRQCTPTNAGHVLSYLRRSTTDRELDILADLGVPIRVYGLGEQAARGGLSFCEISEEGFLQDLSTCDVVISAAGNQLLGESLYFGKPVFALPERKHHEQCLNAHYLQELGGGDWDYLETFTRQRLLSFLDRKEQYRKQLAESGMSFDGTDAAAAAIEAMINHHR